MSSILFFIGKGVLYLKTLDDDDGREALFIFTEFLRCRPREVCSGLGFWRLFFLAARRVSNWILPSFTEFS